MDLAWTVDGASLATGAPSRLLPGSLAPFPARPPPRGFTPRLPPLPPAPGSVDHTVIVWDTSEAHKAGADRRPRPLAKLEQHQHYVQGVAWDPFGRAAPTSARPPAHSRRAAAAAGSLPPLLSRSSTRRLTPDAARCRPPPQAIPRHAVR